MTLTHATIAPAAPGIRRLGGLAESSIVRRALVLMAFVVPGHVLNYALVIGATHVLSAVAFGIFYAAVSITNVLVAPAAVLALFVSRRLALIRAREGDGRAVAVFRVMFRRIARGIGLAAVPTAAAIAVLGATVGIESFTLTVAIVATAAAIYLAETVRAALQGLQRFVVLGLAGLTWMAARLVLALAALAALGTAWAGMAGILAAAAAAAAAFHRILTRGAEATTATGAETRLEGRKLTRLGIGYGLYSAVIYLDVLAGYLLVDRESLGIYAASSVLPKAVVLILLPVAQVMFPVLVSEAGDGGIRGRSVAKALGLTATVGAAGATLIAALSGVACGDAYGVGGCAPDLMAELLVAAVPLCLLRVLVLVQFARERDLHPLLLVVPVAAFAAYLVGLDALAPLALARGFVVFAWATLAFYGAVCLLDGRARGTVSRAA